VVVTTRNALDDLVRRGGYAIAEDPMLVCESENVEAIIEVTGAVEFGATVAMKAIEHGKHVILMNAEFDGTVGPIWKVYADKAGLIVSGCDGDQPGVQMNLYRF